MSPITHGLAAWVLLANAPRRERNGRTIIAAAVQGNTHDVGVRMIADTFEMDGWRSIYLGANIPAADLASAVADFGGELVAISAALPTQLQTVADTIELLRRCTHNGPTPRIIVGGCALAGIEDLWERLGADAGATDPEQALAVGNALAGLPGSSRCAAGISGATASSTPTAPASAAPRSPGT